MIFWNPSTAELMSEMATFSYNIFMISDYMISMILSSLNGVQLKPTVAMKLFQMKFIKIEEDWHQPDSGVSNVIVSLIGPLLPAFRTRTPAVMCEYGQSRLVWPLTKCSDISLVYRLNRWFVKLWQGIHVLMISTSTRWFSGSSDFQKWI